MKKAVVILLCACLCACSSKHYYVKGLEKARLPNTASIYNGLVSIGPENKKLQWDTIGGQAYVLVTTWKPDTTFYTRKYDAARGMYSYNTGNYAIFVTAAPYLKEMDLGELSDKKLTLRLDELLGLPPTAAYKYFLEIWVKPQDIFRPCFDASTGTNVCEYAPSAADNSNSDHMNWLYNYIYYSYCDTNLMAQYPFTHLGYTYDWSPKNKSHVGLSEFVIGKNKDIYIRKVYTTRSYFGG